MNDLEKQALKDILKLLADKELPALIAALEEKLPAAYKAIVVALMAEVQPELLKLLDAKIDAI